MEYAIIILVSFVLLLILFLVLQINIKKVKQLGEDKEINELTKEYPENIEICRQMLKKLGNTTVEVKEDKESKTSLYMVIGDSITIANIRDSFTRIQTIAHECLHSVQAKTMLWFNFIFTNLYLLYFIVIMVLTLTKVITNPMLYLVILIILGMFQFFIRSMLETEAMTKAPYLAKEYLEENKIGTKEDCDKIISQYHKMNVFGIRFVNFDLLARNLIKVMLYAFIAIFVK